MTVTSHVEPERHSCPDAALCRIQGDPDVPDQNARVSEPLMPQAGSGQHAAPQAGLRERPKLAWLALSEEGRGLVGPAHGKAAERPAGNGIWHAGCPPGP